MDQLHYSVVALIPRFPSNQCKNDQRHGSCDRSGATTYSPPDLSKTFFLDERSHYLALPYMVIVSGVQLFPQ